MTTIPSGQVDISDVNVVFKDASGKPFTALTTMRMRLEPGSFTALVGPSGCGKSTLLNVVAGFQKPTTGAAILDGKEISGPLPEIGVVFQQYALFPWFSAIGNVEFALKRESLTRAERRAKALNALTEVGLAERAGQFPRQLSGGMKQRVALARTFAGGPKVLLLDEPFGALDAITRARMQRLLLDIWGRRRTTVLFITHDIDEALIVADRVHVMSPGPGRIIETIEVNDPRPRSHATRSPETLAASVRILDLLIADETKT